MSKYTRVIASLLSAAALLTAGAFQSAQATSSATHRVCASGCPFMSIQAAINAATPGDTIEIASGTYSETLTISIAVTLAGGYLGAPTWAQGPAGSISVIRGDQTHSVITISGAPAAPLLVVLRNVRIENGRGAPNGGGINARFVDLAIADSIIAGNTTTATIENDMARGGGLYLEAGTLEIDRSVFQDNAVACTGLYCPITDGGGVFVTGTLSARINNSTFNNNSGWVGASIAGVNATVFISGSTFLGNSGAYGAGVYSIGSIVTVTASSFSRNWAGGGAVLASYFNASTTYERNALVDNSAARAIVETNNDQQLRLVNNVLLANTLVYSNSGSALIYAHATNGLIAHNTIAAPRMRSPEQPMIYLVFGGGGYELVNNVLVSATVGITTSSGVSYTLRNTIMHRIATSLGGATPIISESLMLADPLLISDSIDGRLRTGSPAINAGVPLIADD